MLKLAPQLTKGRKRFALDLKVGLAKEVRLLKEDGVAVGILKKILQ